MSRVADDPEVAARASYHDDDWRLKLERGQAGAAFFRWWWDRNVAPQLDGRGVLFHTGFDPEEVVPVEEKQFLNEGGNLPDFAFVRHQHRPASAGNVIASFSVNLQKRPYDMHSGALAAGCYGCAATSSCYAKQNKRIWVNEHHQNDSRKIEARWSAPDFRVTVLLGAPERLSEAIRTEGLHDSLLNYLRGGLPAISIAEHAARLEQLDRIGYRRGGHNPQIVWLHSADPVFDSDSTLHHLTKVTTRSSPRRVHCVAMERARGAAELADVIVELERRSRSEPSR